MKVQALLALFAIVGATNAVNPDQRKAHHNLAKRQVASTPPAGPPPPGIETITSGMPPQPTRPISSTYAAGATPPVHDAPPLPTPLVFNPADWPAQDKIPDVNSPEVQRWLMELEGFDIPDLPPTKDGSCAGDPQAATDAANRGWWTCGGYTRPTDITACPDKLTWGVSFDDGPSPYSETLLDFLSEKNIKATFFVVGSRVIERPAVLVEEYMTGHELSVHTWSHKPLTSLTNEEIVAELGWTRKAIRDVVGVSPTTMRPPFGDIDDRVRAISLAMGMRSVIWTRTPTAGQFDTNDWKVAGGLVSPQNSYDAFQTILANAAIIDTGFIVLQHDLFQVTVDLAVGYTLNSALSFNPPLTLQSIGQCLKMPPGDLYFETTSNTTFPYRNSSSGYDIDGDGVAEFANNIGVVGSSAVSHTPILTLISVLSAIVMGTILL